MCMQPLVLFSVPRKQKILGPMLAAVCPFTAVCRPTTANVGPKTFAYNGVDCIHKGSYVLMNLQLLWPSYMLIVH